MDPLSLLNSIYQRYRERRLADALELLSDEFKLTVSLPDDLPGDGQRTRSKAETALMAHVFLEQYELLVFEPHSVEISGDAVIARPIVECRHRKSGRVLKTEFIHTWHIADGKAFRLHHQYDAEDLRTFLASIEARA
jgi:ketosteroid isomerase-like protein